MFSKLSLTPPNNIKKTWALTLIFGFRSFPTFWCFQIFFFWLKLFEHMINKDNSNSRTSNQKIKTAKSSPKPRTNQMSSIQISGTNSNNFYAKTNPSSLSSSGTKWHANSRPKFHKKTKPRAKSKIETKTETKAEAMANFNLFDKTFYIGKFFFFEWRWKTGSWQVKKWTEK